MILQDNRETNETSWINIAKICSMGERFNICKAIYFSLSYAFFVILHKIFGNISNVYEQVALPSVYFCRSCYLGSDT